MKEKKTVFFLLLICVVSLAFFANKPFHMDDTLFLYSAKHILLDFTRPYDFSINWFAFEGPAWKMNKNPPLSAYILAFLIKIFSDREMPLHLAYIFFPLVSLFALYMLAKKFVKNAVLPALFLLISPAFFVSSTNLMCDIPQIAFYLGSLTLYIYGLDRNKAIYFILSGLLAGFAVLTKYTALSILLVFSLYSIISGKKNRKAWFSFLIPLVMLGFWGLHGIYFYGKPHFFDLSEDVPFFWEAKMPALYIVCNFIEFLIFLSGCSLFVIFLSFPQTLRRIKTHVIFWLSVISLSLIFTAVILWQLDADRRVKFDFMFIFLFLALSIAFLGNIFLYFLKGDRNRNLVFLFSWFALNSFLVTLNYTVAARFILLCLPPIAILAIYLIEEKKFLENKIYKKFIYIGSTTIFTVTLLLAYSDYCFAVSYKNFSAFISEAIPDKRLWFVGHWGFQYYMEKKGFRQLDFKKDLLLRDKLPIKKGDIIIVPMSNTSPHSKRLNEVIKPYRVYIDERKGFFSVMYKAGFYSQKFGPLPYWPGASFSEKYQLYEVI